MIMATIFGCFTVAVILEIAQYVQLNKHLNCINTVLQLSIKDVEK